MIGFFGLYLIYYWIYRTQDRLNKRIWKWRIPTAREAKRISSQNLFVLYCLPSCARSQIRCYCFVQHYPQLSTNGPLGKWNRKNSKQDYYIIRGAHYILNTFGSSKASSDYFCRSYDVITNPKCLLPETARSTLSRTFSLLDRMGSPECCWNNSIMEFTPLALDTPVESVLVNRGRLEPSSYSSYSGIPVVLWRKGLGHLLVLSK